MSHLKHAANRTGIKPMKTSIPSAPEPNRFRFKQSLVAPGQPKLPARISLPPSAAGLAAIATTIILSAMLLCSNSSFADGTWTGGGTTGNWSDNGNWGGSAPTYGTLNFPNNTKTTTTNDTFTSENKLLWTGTNAWTLFNAGGTVLSLFDNGGTQAKVENQSTNLVTINAPITFAANNASPPFPFGEINAVNGDLLFTNATLTVNGSSVNGIKMFGTGRTTIFSNTVSASGKWFGLTATTTTATIGGSFTSGDFYLMNGGTLNLNSAGSFTTTALRLGGDFSNTGNQNQTLGGTFNLTSLTGGQTFSGIINSVSGNTSGALVVNSANTSGTNTLSGGIFLDSGLRFTNAAGGTLQITGGTDVKAQQIIFGPSGTITVGGLLTNSLAAGGTLLLNGPGTLLLTNVNNTYTGTGTGSLNANGTQISGGGTLGIWGDGSLGLAPAGAYNNIQFTGSGTLQDTTNNISLNATRNISVASAMTATLDSSSNSFTIPGVISGSGAVTKIGAGTLTLSATNTYSGATTIGAGTLQVGSGTTDGSISASSSITNNAALIYNLVGSQTNSNVITGTGTLTKTNTGTLTLSGANTYSGATTIGGGTLVAATTNALGTTAGGVTFSGTSGTTTLDVQTDGGDTAYNVSFGSASIGSTMASDVKTGSVGTNHTLGTLSAGNATLNVVKGSNVASGSPSITFGTVNMSAGTAGTTILNPTTASLSLGAVSIASGANAKTLQLDGTSTNNTVTGAIANGLAILTVFKNNSSTWTLSNAGNSYSGNTSVGGGTLNLTGGAGVTNGFFVNNGGTLTLSGTFGTNAVTINNFIIGQTAGKGTLNVLAGATIPRVNMFVGDGAAGDGAVYQTGGTVTLSQAAGIDNLRVGSTTGGKGYYKLTGGSVTAARPAIGASLPDTFGVFDMTNGTLTSTEQIHITAGSATSSGLLNVMGGTVSAGTDIRMLTLAAGTAGATQQAVLNVGGGTFAASVTSGNNAGQGMNLAQTANIAGELSVVNLLTNGTLTTSRILGTQLNPTTHFNFNGGKLKANTTVANPLFNDGGVDAINVYTNGGTIDNSGVAVTIGGPLLAPTGNGVSSITGPATQGSNYIGAPLVAITGGTGSGATAYAVMADDGSGKTFKVSSIVVTSPGLYSVAPTTVTLVGGGAGTVASGFTINTAANTSGSMTFTGAGATTLSGANTYAGTTTVNAGELVGLTGGSLSNSPITVVSGATNGVQLASAGGQWSCTNLTYSTGPTYADFYFNGFAPSTTTAPLLVKGSLALTVTPNIIVRSTATLISVGQYPLIKYTGALSGTPPATALSLPPGVTATISNNTANSSIDLVVTVGNQVTWAVGNAAWDINTTASWTNGTGALVNYLDGEAVLFDDTASGASPITVSLGGVTVTPAAITANLTNKNYTISSTATAGVFTGSGPLVKNGSGTLTVATTNSSYTGSITVNGGTLSLGNGSNPIGTGTLTLNNGTTFSLPSSGTAFPNNPIFIPAGASATNTSAATGNGIGGNISSGDNTSILTIANGNTTSYSGGSQQFGSFLGTVTIAASTTLRFSANSSANNFGGTNATWIVNGTMAPRNAGNTISLGSLSGPGSLTGNSSAAAGAGNAVYQIGYNNASTTFSGNISSNSAVAGALTTLTKVGTGNLTLSGNSTLNGTTTISSGQLTGVTGGSCSNTAVTVSSGATNGVNVTAAGGTWACSNLTYSAGTAYSTFAFGAITPSINVAPLQVLGSVTISGTLNILITGNPMPLGTYPLINYVNTLSGVPVLTPLAMPRGNSGYITNDIVNKLVSLVITNSLDPLVWQPGNGLWDTATANWKDQSGTTTSYVNPLDSVLFNDTPAGSGPFTVTNNSSFTPAFVTVSNVTKQYTLTGNGGLTGTTSLAKNGAGTLVLLTTNSYAGGTIISGGTLQGNTASLPGAITDNASLVFDQSFNGTNSNVISGTGSVMKQNSGTLTFVNTNTYAGGTTISAGTLQLGDGAVKNGAVAGTVTDNATLAFANPLTQTFGAVISGSGSLTKSAAGTLNLGGSANNTYAGLTAVNGGTLALSATTANINAIGGDLVINSGSTVNYANTIDNQIPDASNITNNTGTLAFGARSETFKSLVNNGGTNTVSSGTVTMLNNSYITNGYMQITAGGEFDFSNSVTLVNAILDMTTSSSVNSRFRLLGGEGTGIIVPANATAPSVITNSNAGGTGTRFAVGPGSSVYTYTTVFNIADAPSVDPELVIGTQMTFGSGYNGNIRKDGAGKMAITVPASTSFNPTNFTVNQGTLALIGAGSITKVKTLQVNNGAVFDVNGVSGGAYSFGSGQTLTGNGMVSGSLTNAGATLAPGDVGTPGLLTVTGNLANTSGATNLFDLTNNTTIGSAVNDLIVVGGSLTASGVNTILINPTAGTLAIGTYTLIQYGTLHGSSLAGNFTVAFTTTPPRVTTTVVDNLVTKEIDLVVTANPASLVWAGDGSANNWNTTSSNWVNVVVRDKFFTGDSTTFDDTSTNPVVSLVGSLSPAAVTVNATSNYTFSGSGKITGSTGLTKTNTGTLTVLTTNDYTGTTTISAGTLLVNGSITASATVASAATLGGTGAIGGTVTVNAGGTLAPGTSIGTLTLSSSPALNGTTLMEINRTNAQTADLLVLTVGALNYGGALTVTNIGPALQGGDTFTLFSAPATNGAFAATNLPTLGAGQNWWTTNNYVSLIVNQVAAGSITNTRAKGLGLKIKVSDLLTNVTSLPAGGDTFILANVSASTNGSTITTNSTYIFFTPGTGASSNSNESFTYTVSDVRGGSATGLITVNVISAVGGPQTITVSGSTVTVNFAGIPGYTYAVQRSTNLVSWVTLITTNAPPAGLFIYTDDFSDLGGPPASAYYRTAQP